MHRYKLFLLFVLAAGNAGIQARNQKLSERVCNWLEELQRTPRVCCGYSTPTQVKAVASKAVDMIHNGQAGVTIDHLIADSGGSVQIIDKLSNHKLQSSSNKAAKLSQVLALGTGKKLTSYVHDKLKLSLSPNADPEAVKLMAQATAYAITREGTAKLKKQVQKGDVNSAVNDDDGGDDAPPDNDDPPEDNDDPPEDNDDPPEDNDDPPQDNDDPPQDNDDPPQDDDDPPQDNDDPPQDNDDPPQDNDDPPQDDDDPPQDDDDPPQDNDDPPQDNDDPPQDNDDPPQDNDDSAPARAKKTLCIFTQNTEYCITQNKSGRKNVDTSYDER